MKRSVIFAVVVAVVAGCFGTASAQTCAVSDSAAVVNTIMARRSIRAYKDMPVEKSKLEVIAQCGINAPSGINKQPWQIRIIQDAEWTDALTGMFREANPKMAGDPGFKNMFRNAPCQIFIATPKEHPSPMDCGILAENMVLAAQSMGLGTCIMGGPVRFLTTTEACKPYLDQLEIPDDYELTLVIGVGYADESPEAKPRDASKVKFIGF